MSPFYTNLIENKSYPSRSTALKIPPVLKSHTRPANHSSNKQKNSITPPPNLPISLSPYPYLPISIPFLPFLSIHESSLKTNIFTYLHIYIFIYLYIYIFIYLYIYIFTYLYIYIFTYLHIYIFIYLHIYIFTFRALYIYFRSIDRSI